MTLGVGIIGFAHGHVNAYCTRWEQEPGHGIRVVAGWDHDPARLDDTASKLHIEPMGKLEALLARRDVEAVVIAAETSMHADLVEQAAAAGKTIALQKPMALTLAEADRIVAAVQQHAVRFTMAWQMRVDPQNIELKAVMERGELGRVYMVRRRHGLPTQLWNVASMWHFDPRLNRDIWADDAAHPIDFVHWLLGVPQTVTAEIASLHDPAAPNDNGIAIFRYPDGLLAEVVCSFTCLAAENTVEVIGARGSLIQNYGDVPSCNVPRPAALCGQKWYTRERQDWTCSPLPTPAGHGERIAGLAGPLAEFFHDRRPAIATAVEGHASLRMVLATYVASREGRRVRLDDPAIGQV